MFRALTLIFLVSLSPGLYGQKNKELVQSTRDNFNYGTFNPGTARMLYGVDESPGYLLGDIYLDSAFHTAAIRFYPEIVKAYDSKASDSVSGYQVRLDLREHVVEFVIGDFVKGIENKVIRSITYQRTGASHPTLLVNTREFAGVPVKMSGFVEVLSKGKAQVLKYTHLKVRQPTYNPALVSGDKNAVYYKQPEYFYVNPQGQVVEFRARNKKELLELLSDRRAVVEKFIEEHKITLKNDEDLIKVLNFYNDNT